MAVVAGCPRWERPFAAFAISRMKTLRQPSANGIARCAIFAVIATFVSGCATSVSAQSPGVTSNQETRSAESLALDKKLIKAAYKGKFARAQLLVEQGADVNASTKDGMTPLIIAARKEDPQLARFLLDHGADTERSTPGDGTALTAAAKRGHLLVITELVERGANINAEAPGVGTPLIVAVRTDHTEVVKYLVDHGADVNLKGPLPPPWNRHHRIEPIRRSPLEVAEKAGHAWTASYLKSMGARSE